MYEELIAALNAADKRPCSDLECPGSGECPTVGCLFREAADAIEELQAAVAGYEATTDVEFVKEDGRERIRFVPKWVSVKERLPEPGVPCLCWCKGGTFGQIRWYGLYYLTSHRTWAIYDNDYENQEVTHWMYRPEPPKEATE